MAAQRGSGTLMTAVVMAVILLVTGVSVLVCVVALAQRDAANAADLSALSGAAAVAKGQDPCPTASRIAVANGVKLLRCRVSGDAVDFVVSVEVQRRLDLALGLRPTVHAEAHAGRLGSAG
jgi:secretion/DNA translocation related TadE-like protein